MWTRRASIAAAGLRPVGFAFAAEKPLPVVASFSVLGDFVREVGRARVDLTTIVGRNGDAHVYEPTPRDEHALVRARQVFMNGFGFERWIDRLIAASKTKATVVTVSKSVTARQGEEGAPIRTLGRM